MGDVEFGFEEMQGVRLGYLVIQGKQMFALSQVFTDLLKNIPRTTVHKRMDHLKVQKHQCDLRQLRKLKALNSVAFHAAKCTLISREDVEALYVSCKAERGGGGCDRRKPSERERQPGEETPVWAGWSSADRALPRIYGAAFGRRAGLCGKAARKDPKAKRRHREDRCWSREARQLVLLPGCCAPESCCSSSDSESTSSNNDSDFGSSLSTSSTGTSTSTSTSDDEEEDDDDGEEEDDDEEEECASCSTDDSSDEEEEEEEEDSSSDSSSASSHVSSQSIRFRRARLAKAPLLLQPTFRYRESERARALRQLDADVASWRRTLGSCFSSRTSHAPPHLHFLHQPKSSALGQGGFSYSTHSANGTLFSQQRVFGLSPSKLHPAFIPSTNCVQDKDQQALFTLASCIQEAKLGSSPHLKVPSPLKSAENIKTERSEEPLTPSHESKATGKASPFPFKHVKIKVEEDSLDEYEYATRGLADHCKIKSADALCAGGDFGEKEHCKDASKATPPPSQNQEPSSTLNAHCVEERAEDRNGARVRKSHRVPVWGRRTESVKPSVKADRSPRCAGKCADHEGSGEDWTNHSKRRRATSGQTPCLKKPFNFMENFPSPPSLIIGSDGDLSPAYSLNSFRNNQLPHRSHPVWTWQLGACVVPPPPLNQRLRKTIP